MKTFKNDEGMGASERGLILYRKTIPYNRGTSWSESALLRFGRSWPRLPERQKDQIFSIKRSKGRSEVAEKGRIHDRLRKAKSRKAL